MNATVPTQAESIWTPELIAEEKARMDAGIALLCGITVEQLYAVAGPDLSGPIPWKRYSREARAWIKPGQVAKKAA